jgi:hypothetical protein
VWPGVLGRWLLFRIVLPLLFFICLPPNSFYFYFLCWVKLGGTREVGTGSRFKGQPETKGICTVFACRSSITNKYDSVLNK